MLRVNVKPELQLDSPMVIVSHKRKYLYIVIPKVACSSIMISLAKDIGLDLVGVEPHDLLTWPIVDKFEDVISLVTEGYFSFTFVRNPWDRLVSCYEQKVVNDPIGLAMKDKVPELFKQYDYFFHVDMPFYAFVHRVAMICDLDADKHFRSQHLAVNYRDKQVVKFIGRFESLEDDWKVIQAKLGFDNLVSYNRSDRRPYKEYYDEDLKNIVAKRYAKDISYFGYCY